MQCVRRPTVAHWQNRANFTLLLDFSTSLLYTTFSEYLRFYCASSNNTSENSYVCHYQFTSQEKGRWKILAACFVCRHVIHVLERSLASGSYIKVYEHWRHSVSHEKCFIFYRIWPLCLLCSGSSNSMCVFLQGYFSSRCEIQSHLPVSGSSLEDTVRALFP